MRLAEIGCVVAVPDVEGSNLCAGSHMRTIPVVDKLMKQEGPPRWRKVGDPGLGLGRQVGTLIRRKHTEARWSSLVMGSEQPQFEEGKTK
jgi:hypothetical protein